MQSILYIRVNTLHMVQYTSQYQLKIEEFGNLYQMKLNRDNRWIRLAFHFPWDQCAKIYARHFCDTGRTAIDPRIVIGSLVIKHKLNLSDDETVRIIEENPYMQFFLGLVEFAPEPLFSPSLFVEWRKRLGNDAFNGFSDVLATICHGGGDGKKNKGKLKLDATVADQNITYPNDLGLLNTARERTESMIDDLFGHLRDKLKVKPRTYREVARKKYLAESKKRQANKKTLRSAIRYHLNCLDRNIRSIDTMLDLLEENPLPHRTMRDFWVVRTVNDQQREMYSNRTNRCEDRIVSISQPYVRPIVRGKAGKKVEFGTKIGLAHANGFAKAETLSWDAYNESADLVPHAESYRELYGHYPELIQVDRIYGTNANRNWCSERGIRMTVPPKGKRPPRPFIKRGKGKRSSTNETRSRASSVRQNKATASTI